MPASFREKAERNTGMSYVSDSTHRLPNGLLLTFTCKNAPCLNKYVSDTSYGTVKKGNIRNEPNLSNTKKPNDLDVSCQRSRLSMKHSVVPQTKINLQLYLLSPSITLIPSFSFCFWEKLEKSMTRHRSPDVQHSNYPWHPCYSLTEWIIKILNNKYNEYFKMELFLGFSMHVISF